MGSQGELGGDWVYGEELFENEFRIEVHIEKATDGLLADGQLGERAKRLNPQIGRG
jgi:hypothetical protein